MFRYFEHLDGHIIVISEANKKEIKKYENDKDYSEHFFLMGE